MANLQIYIIFVVLISAQNIFGKPADILSNEIETSGESKRKSDALDEVKLFAIANLVPYQHAENAANASRYMLKDKALKANNEPEVLEFKNNLNLLLDKYKSSTTNKKLLYETLDIFANITNHYLHLPEDKVTGESKLIIDVLNKYNCGKFAMSVNSHYELFFEQFIQLFEDNKQDFEKPLLDWYDRFINSNNLAQKIAYMVDFILLF